MNPEQSTFDFYHFFRQKTNNGHVFNRDTSVAPDGALTEDEKRERNQWKSVLDALFEYYRSPRAAAPPLPPITSLALLFQQRLSPPLLLHSDHENVSARSTKDARRRTRLYPSRDGIGVWGSFSTDVEHYQPALREFPVDQFDDLITGFATRINMRTKDDEQGWLVTRLDWSIDKSGLARVVIQRPGTVGLPDFQLTEVSSSRATMICEVRSTHNLRLPCEAARVVGMYQQGYDDNEARVWTNVCHPLAQLVRYMVDNTCRFGALTSATRTYFVRIVPGTQSPIVEVSDAWFLGQPNYIKAWAFVQDESCADPDHGISIDWAAFDKCKSERPDEDATEPDAEPPQEPDPASSAGKRRKTKDGASALLQGSSTAFLDYVSYKDIEIISPLGVGLNGTTFKARWKGIDVAMKQFDLNKGGAEHFQAEMSAYAKLQDVWGELVPMPLFLSESMTGGVQFLGLQLGREYGPSDGVSRKDEQAVRKRIYERGIDLLDHDGRNFLLVPGEDGTERLVAIDLEDYNIVDAVQK